MPTQLDAWRSDTPGIAFRNHLNNAGAALMPAPVIDAIHDHIDLESELGGYEASDAQANAINAGYTSIASLIGCEPRNVAVVANATAGFIQAISSFDLGSGDLIVTSRSDYTSNQIQYLALKQRLGVNTVHAPDLAEGGVDPNGVREILNARTADKRCIVAMSWVPTNSGLVQNLESVGEVCEAAEVPFIVDACQAVGQLEVDVTRLRCDYLSATARKFLRGPRGIGFMFASDRALARGDFPLYVDMRGARWISPEQFEIAPTAKRYEDWEFPYALVLGQNAAVHYALEVGIGTARDRARLLAERLRRGLETIPGARVLDRGRELCALVTVAFDGVEAPAVVEHLASERISAVSSLREFAQLDFGEKRVESAVRLSPHYYNTAEEVDAAVTSIASFVKLVN